MPAQGQAYAGPTRENLTALPQRHEVSVVAQNGLQEGLVGQVGVDAEQAVLF
ncbi:MAG: hypothetical protein WKG07_09700 [Hymenobacter sp.]